MKFTSKKNRIAKIGLYALLASLCFDSGAEASGLNSHGHQVIKDAPGAKRVLACKQNLLKEDAKPNCYPNEVKITCVDRICEAMRNPQ